jgi:proteasome lid subunit RPN8/RPN11
MTFPFSLSIKQAIANHAAEAGAHEACGMIVNQQILRVANSHPSPCSHFAISAENYAAAESKGTIEAIYHSHPQGKNGFSIADVKACKQSNIPWIVYDCQTGNFFYANPTGGAPYEGRQWIYGIHDCYSLQRDYYKNELGIELSDFTRGEEGEWEKPEWQMFANNYADQGFVEIKSATQKGDMLLMQIGAPSPNHTGVFLGDNTFYHHLAGRLSERNVYGGYWAKITTKVLRHKFLL